MRKTLLCGAVALLWPVSVVHGGLTDALVSKWTASDEETEVRLEFTADGQFTRTMSGPGWREIDRGTYRVVGSEIHVEAEGEEVTTVVPFRFVGPDRLWINVPEEGPITLERVKPDKPIKPDGPGKPDQPVKPDEPDESDGPVKPDTEWKSVTGTTPGCTVEERLLSEALVLAATLSPDGSGYAGTVRAKNGERTLVVDGKKGATYAEIKDIVYSPDGHHLLFQAKQDGKWRVVVDDIEYDTCDEIKAFRFSPEGRQLAYLARIGSKWAVDVDGVRGPLWTDVADVTFSADGARWAYKAKQDDQWWIVAGDERWGPYLSVSLLTLSPKGGHVAFVAEKGSSPLMAARFVVRDGKATSIAGKVYSLRFSPDGMRLAYPVVRKNDGFVMLDGDGQATFKDVSSPLFSVDGRRVAYAAVSTEGETFVVVDGKRETKHGAAAGYESVSHFLLDADWSRAVWVALHSESRSWHVLNNGTLGPVCDSVWHLALNADGTRVAAFVKQGSDYFVIVDGKKDGPYVGNVHTKPRFGEDGKRLIYLAEERQNSRQFLVVDGRSGPKGTQLRTLTFSADGRHAAGCLTVDETSECIVVNGEAGPRYAEVSAPRFVRQEKGNAPTVMYLARKGDSLVLVRHAVPKTK